MGSRAPLWTTGLQLVLEPDRARAPHHDVEAVGQAVERDRGVAVEWRDQLPDRRLARYRVQDRTRWNQRVPLEVHLRYEPLRERMAGDRIVDMRGPPIVRVVAPWIRSRLDRAEEVMAVLVGERTTAAPEVRIERRDIAVVRVPITAASVRLPDLDQRIPDRPRVLVEDITVHDDALADRQAALRAIQDEIVVEGAQ